MKQLTCNEIGQVSGGCAKYCWGDFSTAGLTASMVAGAIGGFRGGFAAMALGAISGGVGYAGSKIGDKMSERTYSSISPPSFQQ
ncbi:hypothetical protein GTH32_09220 [Alteromonas sp. 345S023]|uniref:Bacteriocin n=1 Tax=Alteromonas profundi TaxID=2696062 RepID=A0A7X5LL50_9ALTE|nr:hypothetical protein [Alteromonas profundi]NDV91358.1 hypothetical protein [Alteromonas profundi]